MALNLFSRLHLDGRGFDRTLQKSQEKVKAFGKNTAKSFGLIRSSVAFAFGGAGFTILAKNTIDYADRIDKLSKKLNLSTESLQSFDVAARTSGSSLEAIQAALIRLNRRLTQVFVEGSGGTYEPAFRRLGITAEDFVKLGLDGIFLKIAKAIQKNKVPLTELNDVTRALGLGAADLIPVFKDGFADAAESAKTLNLLMKEEIKLAVDVKDAMVEIGTTIKPVILSTLKLMNDVRNLVAFPFRLIGASFGASSVSPNSVGGFGRNLENIRTITGEQAMQPAVESLKTVSQDLKNLVNDITAAGTNINRTLNEKL